jgi:alginate O-acetyltransferase complex protein AlgJ
VSAPADASFAGATIPTGAVASPRRRRGFARPARLTCAVFLLGLAAALPLGIAGVDRFFEFTENRWPAALPPLGQLLDDPKAFVHGVEAFVSDHFALRPLLIGAIGYAKWKLGVGANDHVIVGRGGWMFNYCGPCAEDMRGTAPRRADVIESWTAAFDQRLRRLNGRSRMTVLLVPRKEAVYRDMLPAWALGSGHETHAGHLIEALRGRGVDVLYPLDELRARKEAGKLYYRFDHHFTNLGAVEATQIVVRHLHERYGMPLAPHSFELAPITTSHIPWGDGFSLAVLQGTPWLRDADHRVVRGWTARWQNLPAGVPGILTTKDDARLPTLVMFGDSFVWNLAPFLAEHFRRATFVVFWGANRTDNAVAARLLEQEKPDFVIYARWEHGLSDPAGTDDMGNAEVATHE